MECVEEQSQGEEEADEACKGKEGKGVDVRKMRETNKNKHQHNDDGTTHIFLESKNRYFPGKHTVIIDTEDWDRVKEHVWGIHGSGHDSYPYAKTNMPNPNGAWRFDRNGHRRGRNQMTVRLHYFVKGKRKSPKGMVMDHINRNGLDNRKENLREVSVSQNCANRRGWSSSSSSSSSRYKGVRLLQSGSWQVRIGAGGRTYTATFDCEHEAALAYNEKALELWGEYALLNEVETLHPEEPRGMHATIEGGII